ncbi:hypothetical protein TNCV_588421 [Trichonephila clavipes]|nr:hypothetical protein TNCV_588421 [Trichonephila clavipes]
MAPQLYRNLAALSGKRIFKQTVYSHLAETGFYVRHIQQERAVSRGLLETNLLNLNLGQVTRTKPERRHPSPNSYTVPTGGRLSIDKLHNGPLYTAGFPRQKSRIAWRNTKQGAAEKPTRPAAEHFLAPVWFSERNGKM